MGCVRAVQTELKNPYKNYRYSFYDSLIFVAASETGCNVPISEDMQHSQKIGDLTISNPFK